MTKKTMTLTGTVLAAVIVIAGIVIGFPPSWGGAGSIGGVEEAVRVSPALAQGVNLWRGHLVCEGVAESLDLPQRALAELL